MKRNSLVAWPFKLAFLAILLIAFHPRPVLGQVVTTATYATSWPYESYDQKDIAIGSDGYARYVVSDLTGDYESELVYVRCLDANCGTYNTAAWVIPDLASATFSLALGPDGYARIGYQENETPDGSSPDGYFHGALGFIQCADADCGTSSNNDLAAYTSGNYISSVAVGSDGTSYVLYDSGTDDWGGSQGMAIAVCGSGGCSAESIVDGLSVYYCLSGAIAIGSDGNPVANYIEFDCGTGSSSVHYYEDGSDTVISTDVGGYIQTDLAMGPDGFGRIVFPNTDATGINYVQCTSTPCGSANTATFSGTGTPSVAVQSDNTARLELTQGGYPSSATYIECTASDCSTYNSQAVLSGGDGVASIAVGSDGSTQMIAEDTSGTVYQVTVQVPKSLSVLSSSVISFCPPSASYGIGIAIHYQVLDQNGIPLHSNSMEPQETITNDVFEGMSEPDPEPSWNDVGPTSYAGTSQFTDSNGQFWDAPFGVCGSGGGYGSFTQTIRVLLNGNAYTVRTNNWSYSSSSAGHGSISNGTDISQSQ